MRLQTKLVLLVSIILITSLTVAYLFLSTNANKIAQNEVGNRAKAISSMVAISPTIINGIVNERDHHSVQELAEQVRKQTGVEFVVVIDNYGIRLSHPNESLLGQHMIGGDELAALQGASYTSLAEGTMGPSIRAFEPITYQGRQIGAVITGVSMREVQALAQRRNLQFLLILLAVFACGLGLTFIVAQRIKTTLLGMEPFAIAKLMVERNSIIKSVREGIIVVDAVGRLIVVNEEAKRIFRRAGITGNLIGEDSSIVVPNTRMIDVVRSGKAELDQEQRINNVSILTNRLPLIVEGKIVGSLATFRDYAEVKKMAEELTGVKRYVEALRAQAHEYRNQLHVINGLILNKQYGELSLYVQQLSTMGDNELRWLHKHVQDTVISAFLLSKLSRGREMGVNLILDNDLAVPVIDEADFQNALITVLGNLIDNAIEAVQFTELKNIYVDIQKSGTEWCIKVMDTGEGLDTEKLDKFFEKGFSTKGHNRGFGLFLVGKTVEKYGGYVHVDRNEPHGAVFEIYLYSMKE